MNRHQVTKCMATTDTLACDEHYPLIRYTGQLITSECNFLLTSAIHDGAVKFGLKTRVNFELMAKIASDPDSTVTTAVLVPEKLSY